MSLLAIVPFVGKLHASTIMSDDFESYSNHATFANSGCYNFISFPGGGGATGTCTSPNWESDTGSITAEVDSGGNKWGQTVGDGGGLWRINTTQTAAEPTITWDYKADSSNNATDVWLNYQTQYWLYALQFDRADNCMVAKRKVPTNTAASAQWGGVGAGHSVEIANKGIYYTLRIDSDTPAHSGGPCNVDGVTWTQMGTTNIVYDGTLDSGTVYSFKATLRTIPAATCGTSFDCVQMQLFRGGVLYASWTDKNNGKNFDGTRTVQQDCDAGWFTTVTGYTSDWCSPITAAGKSGIRNDATQVAWIDNFVTTDNSTVDPPAPTATAPVRMGVKSGKVNIKSGKLQIH